MPDAVTPALTPNLTLGRFGEAVTRAEFDALRADLQVVARQLAKHIREEHDWRSVDDELFRLAYPEAQPND